MVSGIQVNNNELLKDEDFFIKLISAIITLISIAAAIFHLYGGAFRPLSGYFQGSMHLLLILPIGYFLSAIKKTASKFSRYFDVVLGLLSMLAMFYAYSEYRNMIRRIASPNQWDIFFGVIAILLVLELTRRTLGLPLVLLGGISILYMFFGQYLHGIFGHSGYTFNLIIYYMFMTTEGLFSSPVNIVAKYIVVFILLAAFLNEAGSGKFFLDLSYAIFGKFRGGPAKIAVIGSAFMGTISGSAVANVVGTGTFTIPLMKSAGYRSSFAAAVEAAASTGGQLMPPIMGAAAFLMIEILGLPYATIILAGLLPALFYFGSLLFMVDLEAAKEGIKGLRKEEIPDLYLVLKRGLLLIPLVILIWALLIARNTPARAAFLAIVSAIIVGFIMQMFTKSGLTFKKCIYAIDTGMRNVVPVSLACATAAIVIGVLTITGLGMRLSGILISLSGGNILLLLFITMITSLILGMGMPTSACYIILAILVAPTLIKMGIQPLAAHFFVFYFGVISNVTPPVAMSVFAASGIAGSNAIRTGFTATRLVFISFLTPYIFVFDPALLMQGSVIAIVFVITKVLIATIAIGIALQGFLLHKAIWLERILFLLGALALCPHYLITGIIGFILCFSAFGFHFYRYKMIKINQ